jgi:diguanylate cyclase (GGDEF)-like protein
MAVLLAWAALAGFAWAAPETPLSLNARDQAIDAWPSARVLADPEQLLDFGEALASLNRFEAPDVPHANLGPRKGATWVHIPVETDPESQTAWNFRLQYALLHDVQLRVYDASGQLVHQGNLGAAVPFAYREQPTRALSTLLHLPRAQRFNLLIRVHTPTATLLPMAFLQSTALGVEESREQMVQGLMGGLWLFMVAYSVINALVHRQSLFLIYACSVLSSWCFAHAVFGTGPQYLWTHSSWWTLKMSTLAPLAMVAANAQFFVGSLAMRSTAPRAAQGMAVISVVAILAALGFALGWMPYQASSVIGMVLVFSHLALVFPAAWRRRLAGDRAAVFLLAGCAIYVAGAFTMIGLLRGMLPVTFFTMHGAQFAVATEMVCWLLLLGARLEQLRRSAADARREHDTLHLLAHTDPLTGLRNRRGLHQAMEGGLHDGQLLAPRQSLAVFMLDLDGFKPVNDRWGHDAGDALLRDVAQRLTHAVRPTDVVARLGGDEFVVAVDGLADVEQAEVIGRKLLAQFAAPFDLGDERMARVGATIGFALGQRPVRSPAELLQRADAAMYAGKQAGKNTVVAAEAA